jgi:hypothetical protein
MIWQMACTGRLVRLRELRPTAAAKMKLFVKRLERNDARIAELEREVIAFLADVDKMLATVRVFA